MISPHDVIDGFVGQHEGGMSRHPADNGNWYDPARCRTGLSQQRGCGVLVGSNWGVTAYALVLYRERSGVPTERAMAITPADMAAITRDLAVNIGMELSYRQPALDRLVWNRVTASVLDKAWESGAGRAVRMLQALVGTVVDGTLGPASAKAYAIWLSREGEEAAAHLWCNARIAFDQSLVSGPNDPDRAFINGWNNRSRSFLPGTPWWRAAA